jgi:hypothetical protein
VVQEARGTEPFAVASEQLSGDTRLLPLAVSVPYRLFSALISFQLSDDLTRLNYEENSNYHIGNHRYFDYLRKHRRVCLG